MKYFVLLVLFSISCNSSASERIQETIEGLSSPVEFVKVEVTRGSPTIYFDQAISSIPEMNRGVKFLCKQRFVNFNEVSLSVYCFTTIEKKLVSVGGELVKGSSAWVYSVDLEPEKLNDQMVILIEALNHFANGRL